MTSAKKILLPTIAVAILSVVSLYVAWLKSPVNGQNVSVSPDQNTSPTPKATENVKPKSMSDAQTPMQAALETAAIENARLRYNLEWVFGGKAQRGWYLYVPLIQHTIATERDAETPEFALALACWQQQSGLSPTGTLESETLYQMIKWWQSRRIGNRVYPAPDELLTAPIADFYDPTREVDLLKVEREAYAAYKRMVAEAARDLSLNLKTNGAGELSSEEKYLKIISAFRSREYQEKLRRESPKSGRAGLATNSPHFTGRALDIYVGGEPVETIDYNRAIQVQTPVYKWLVKNAERFGFYPYYYETCHWEYVPENLKSSTLPVR